MKSTDRFKTVITALVTPFDCGKVDYKSLEKLLVNQIESGVGGFVINGTTAESPTLIESEVENIFSFVRKAVGSKTLLIVGTGTNSTISSIENSKKAEQLGAEGLLVVVPYYNKPPQRGLVSHFTNIAQSVSTPVILYNVPGRTITSLELDSIHQLSKVKNIIGIKEASGNIDFGIQIRDKCGSDFVLLSGDDTTYLEFLKMGGHGVISVASHVIPKAFCEWTRAPHAIESQASFSKYLKLMNSLFIEANPIPVKKALQLMKVINHAELRLPLVELSDENTTVLQRELRMAGIS